MSQKQNYKGLTDAEVLESRKKNGVNILTPPEQDPWWKEFLDKFSDPLIIILLVAGVFSYRPNPIRDRPPECSTEIRACGQPCPWDR